MAVLISLRPQKQNNSEQFPCWGCKTWQHFPTLSKMLEHIENNECHNRWTIQHLNALAEKCTESALFIIPGRELWFLAGAPPLKPKQTDYIPYHNFFVCSICDKEFGRESRFREHLEGQECSRDYPSVLQCPRCPNYGFKRLSELFRHFEEQDCHGGRGWVASFVQNLKRRFEDPGVQRRLDRDRVWLRADKRRPGMLRLAQELR